MATHLLVLAADLVVNIVFDLDNLLCSSAVDNRPVLEVSCAGFDGICMKCGQEW